MKVILDKPEVVVGGEVFEVINPGTDYAFVKGCYGNRYRDAVWREIDSGKSTVDDHVSVNVVER